MSNSLIKHQNQQITNLIRLIDETSSQESELLTRIGQMRKAAELKRKSSIEEFEDSLQHKQDEVAKRKEESLLNIENRRELEPKVLKEKHEQRVIEINLSAEEITERTEAKLNEAIWLSESLYEAGIMKPREKAQKELDTIEEKKVQLDTLCEEAPRTLTKLRQSLSRTLSDDSQAIKFPMQHYVAEAEKALEAIQSDPKAKWFSGIRPLFIVLIVTTASIAAAGAITDWTMNMQFFGIPFGAMLVSALMLFITFASGKNSVRKKYTEFNDHVNLAKQVHDVTVKEIDEERRAKEQALLKTRDADIKKAEDKYKPKLTEVDRLIQKDLAKEKERFEIVAKKLEAKIKEDATNATTEHDSMMEQLKIEEKKEKERIETEFSKTMSSIEKELHESMNLIAKRWTAELHAFDQDSNQQIRLNNEEHPPWNTDWSDWRYRTDSSSATVPLGLIEVNLETIAGPLPISEPLHCAIEKIRKIPCCSSLPSDTSILVQSSGKHRNQAISLLQNSVLRVLTAIPPGKAKLTLIDPVGLGQSFAHVLHLADYEESQLLDRAWTEPRHIETQLARLTEHMETVIQKYLRNEFQTIDEYNEQAGEIAEPYRFLVIADLPNNFSENASKRLSSIITSGARCGVYVIIHQDTSLPLPAGIDDDTLRRIPLRFLEHNAAFSIDDDVLRNLPLHLEEPPSEETSTMLVKKIGEAADKTHRVEVPFSVIAPQESEQWSRSTKDKIAIPLGRSGATKLQNLTLGRGTAQHALIAGKTGSGKSTLLHVLITNLALWYSPDEVEFYLVDFKKGVEFKSYATQKLPHARVVAVESDREFGVSVLQKIDEELKRRGELFRDIGVQDIAGFRDKSTDSMPRILLIIDEFQEFFVDDDRVAQEANLLLDRLVRQGRAFGIHAIMGSQTLDGAYTLSRSTMGQMAVRVALQCSEQDSYIILNEDNAAARLLSRPGEAIYNDAAGNVEGNSPFQIVWISDKDREKVLSRVIERDADIQREMIVYEGNQPLFLENNNAFNSVTSMQKPLAAKAWLGGAMAITEDTYANFRKTSGSNLVIVGQQDETTTTLVNSSIISIDRQYSQGSVEFIVLDGTPQDAAHASTVSASIASLSNEKQMVGVRDVNNIMTSLHEELKKRLNDEHQTSPSIYLVINALHRFRDLRRNEDDYGFSMGGEDKPKTASQILGELLKEGPPLGIHIIVSTDTLANLNRTFDRQSLREFDMRVLLQMGANDSTNLIDSPDASRLGMHRALLYSEETGTIEPFRPYATKA